MEANSYRFTIVTGKGGVGKTTYAKALVQSLRQQGKDVLYLTFSSPTISEHEKTQSTAVNNSEMTLYLDQCAEGYIGRKLNSTLMAKWVVKASFFRALTNMMPGFGYLLFMGKTLELLKENPNRHIVLDAPASGHALTMLEATRNFREIFQSGLVFEDTEKMWQMLFKTGLTRLIILTLPGPMAMHEALELRDAIAKLGPMPTSILLNQALLPWQNKLTATPKAITDKLALEQQLMEQYSDQLTAIIPYSTSENPLTDMLGTLQNLG